MLYFSHISCATWGLKRISHFDTFPRYCRIKLHAAISFLVVPMLESDAAWAVLMPEPRILLKYHQTKTAEIDMTIKSIRTTIMADMPLWAMSLSLTN